MFKNILKYFTKQKPKHENNVLAEICIRVSEGSNVPDLDIYIDDYSSKCVKGLASIIHSIQTQACSMQIIKMATENMRENDKKESLVDFLIQLGIDAGSYAMQTEANLIDIEEKREEPCIKPSDMLK